MHLDEVVRGADVATYFYQEPSAVELARFPVRFFAKGAEKVTGKLTFALDGKSPRGLQVLSQTYAEAAAPVMDLSASNEPVLPPGLEIEIPLMPARTGLLKFDERLRDLNSGRFSRRSNPECTMPRSELDRPRIISGPGPIPVPARRCSKA